MGSAPSLLSMVSVTSARPSGGREVVPAKTTSSILPPRSDLAPCSPMTQARASTMLDLPEPLGTTTQVMPGSSRSEVADANDLKPRRVRLFRYIRALPPAQPRRRAAGAGSRLAETLPCSTVKCGLLRIAPGDRREGDTGDSLVSRWHRIDRATGCRVVPDGIPHRGKGQDNRDGRSR